MLKKFFIILLFLIACIGSGYLVASEINKPGKVNLSSNAVNPGIANSQILNSQLSADQLNQKTQPSDIVMPQKMEQKVPFVVQAPFANWKDPIFQNACEEASMIMAMGWTSGVGSISAQDTQNQIENIVNFENKKFGYNADTDINDMQIIFNNFFHYSNIKIQENITLTDIENEIQKGNIVLVPAFGQALGNPNYTAPGPIAHMLVIIGYDPTTKKFITNDPGTRHGSSYLYSENVLFDAIWEYPSGSKAPQPLSGTMKKGMLIVTK